MSSTTRIAFSFYAALQFTILLQIALGADPLFHFCSNSQNFTANSTYEMNLNKLLSDLSIKAPPTGFGLGSVGENPFQTNGLSLCRGDVSNTDCNNCIIDAGKEARKRCPYSKGAIIWYDNCLLKYSDDDFFGRIDTQNRFYMWNLRTVSDPQSFNQKTNELLSKLSKDAYVTPMLYATGESNLGESNSNVLYGLVQCTRDLSAVDCKKCLDGAISELPRCCDGKEGGRVVGGSCNFRYEIYRFVNV